MIFSEVEQNRLVAAYVQAWASEAQKVQALTDSIDWDGIRGFDDSDAEERRLSAEYRLITDVVVAKKAAVAAGVDEYGNQLHAAVNTPEFRWASDASAAFRAAVDKLRDLGKVRTQEAGRAELAAMPADAPMEDRAAAIFRKHGYRPAPARLRETIDHINGRTALGHLRDVVGNTDNKASREIFAAITGRKLPATRRDSLVVLDEWFGVTPEQRAQMDAEREASRLEKLALDDLLYAWNALKQLNVRLDGGRVVDGQGYVQEKFTDGFTEASRHKQGASFQYGLTTGSSTNYVKNAKLNAFLKQAIEFGGLRKALEKVWPDIPADKVVAEEASDPEIDALFGADGANAAAEGTPLSDVAVAELNKLGTESVHKLVAIIEADPLNPPAALNMALVLAKTAAAQENRAQPKQDAEFAAEYDRMTKELAASVAGIEEKAAEITAFIKEAIRWANEIQGQYGTDWMMQNLPSWLAAKLSISNDEAKAELEKYFAGDAGTAPSLRAEVEKQLPAGYSITVGSDSKVVMSTGGGYTVTMEIRGVAGAGFNRLYAEVSDGKKVSDAGSYPRPEDDMSGAVRKVLDMADMVVARFGRKVTLADASGVSTEDSSYYYVYGDLGMTRNGSFTKEKRDWMMFGHDEALPMLSKNILPYGATKRGVFVGAVSGDRLTLPAKPVTPQVPAGDMEQYIKVAADSIGALRRVDVYRVLVESNRIEHRAAIAAYIRAKRPDLVDEVDDVLAEEEPKKNRPSMRG